MLPRMLPRMLRRGLFLPLASASSAFNFSVLGLTIGGLVWIFAPALNVRSSRKSSRSAANLRRAWSKSKSAGNPSNPIPSPPPEPLTPVLPFSSVFSFPRFGGGSGRMVALLRLLLVLPSMSSNTRPSPEIEGDSESLDRVEMRLAEFWRECRAVARDGVVTGLSLFSPSPSSAIVSSSCWGCWGRGSS
ncbi:hypothetical protein VTG60DRAFT_5366 [Thermothelomyces hinnuleus]